MKPQFITDDAGNRTGVILSISDYEKLMDELDENDTVRMYDEAKKEELTFRPFDDSNREERFPLRGKPLRYDRPFEPTVEHLGWEVTK